MERSGKIATRVALVLTVVVLIALPALGQEAREDERPLGGCVVAWLPFLLVLGLWVFFVWHYLGKQRKRAYEHMDKVERHLENAAAHRRRLESQNERIIEALERRAADPPD